MTTKKLIDFRKVEPGDVDSCSCTRGSGVLSKNKKTKQKTPIIVVRVFTVRNKAINTSLHIGTRFVCTARYYNDNDTFEETRCGTNIRLRYA